MLLRLLSYKQFKFALNETKIKNNIIQKIIKKQSIILILNKNYLVFHDI